jgi:hypothetical protein
MGGVRPLPDRSLRAEYSSAHFRNRLQAAPQDRPIEAHGSPSRESLWRLRDAV